jgi:hypothetical protein
MKLPAFTRAPGAIGATARFGQRQIHGLTGWKPKGGLESIRGGTWAAQRRVEDAEKALEAARAGKAPVGLMARLRGGTPEQIRQRYVRGAAEEGRKARAGLTVAREAEEMGLTSLPGYARSMARDPLKTIGTGFRQQWHEMGPVGRSLIYGFPAATATEAYLTPTQPGGPGKPERIGRSLGELVYGMGPLPISSMLLAAPMLSAVGGGTGKALSKLRGKQPPAPPQLDPAGGQAVPEEYLMSDRMTGLGGSAT